MANLPLEHLPHLLCVLDFDNNFKQVNEAWQYNLGIAADNLLSTTFTHWIHPDDLKSTQNSLSQLHLRKSEWVTFETRWHDTNTNYHRLLWIATVSLTEQLIYAVGLEVLTPKPKNSISKTTQTTDYIVCY
jgi:PAS domain S-box-containing protein